MTKNFHEASIGTIVSVADSIKDLTPFIDDDLKKAVQAIHKTWRQK